MIGDYYGEGNRYRGVTSRASKTRTIVLVGNAVLLDTAQERPDADEETQGTTDANKEVSGGRSTSAGLAGYQEVQNA